MIAQSFDLFGTPDAPVTVNTARTPHQTMLFAGELFAHADPNRKPAEAVALDPTLHDTTIDDAIPATVAVGDRFRDPNLLGSPCLVTEVDPAGEWFLARWIPGAPAHRYPTSAAARWLRVAPVVDDRPEVIAVADLTDADVTGLLARSREVTDDYICPATGLTRAELAAVPDAEPEPAPAPAARPVPPVTAATRRITASGVRDFLYVGLVRITGGGRGTGPIITECGHQHANRDWSTGAAGGSARDCARRIIAGATNPATAEHTARRLRSAPLGLRPTAGFQHPAGTIEAATAAAEANADGYLAAVAAVRAHLGAAYAGESWDEPD